MNNKEKDSCFPFNFINIKEKGMLKMMHQCYKGKTKFPNNCFELIKKVQTTKKNENLEN